jgi:hypothetical protein
MPPITVPKSKVDVSPYVFDIDVPIPKLKGKPPRGSEGQGVPFHLIPVGQSFFARGGKQSTISSAAVAYRRRYEDTLFVTRYYECDPKYQVPGVRVWRTR